MLGAIIGDIVGSRFEHHNIKSKEFEFFTPFNKMTDDSMMTLAVAKAILESEKNPDTLRSNAIQWMQAIGQKYPYAGYGGRFRVWLRDPDPLPYRSWGNGAAMRVSPCGFAANSIEEAKNLSRIVTEVSHNHDESFKAAEAVSAAIFLGMHGSSFIEIQKFITENYYDISFDLDDIRSEYTFDVSCQGSVPQAFEALFESTSFEDAIRNAISIGGDSDTIAAITGGMAEAIYGIPDEIRNQALSYFKEEKLLQILTDFENKYPTK